MEIIFAGGSHYETNGLVSVQQYFDKVYILNYRADSLIPLMRKSDRLINNFDDVTCKFVFLCGYPKFITSGELAKKQYINIHGALLPKYRGMHPTFYAIMNNEKELGITFHLVNEFMDAGDILAQYSFNYTGQIVAEINDRIDMLVGEHAGQVVFDYVRGNILPIAQNTEEAIFGAKRNLEDCLIDFDMDNEMLRRFFRALTPTYPYPMLLIRGEKYEILPEVRIVEKEYFGPKGRVVNNDQEGTWIKTKEGYLIVKNVRKYGTDNIIELAKIVPIGYRF